MATTTFFVTKNLINCAFFLLILSSIAVIPMSSFQFQVGGETGWTKPAANNSVIYNEWASKNRFHVGDYVYFKYKKDSVLVVNKGDYKNCILSNPVSKHEDGNTIIKFDRNGFFYFISGQPGHCKSGQKMVVDVMAQTSPANNPEPAPSPNASEIGGGDGDGWDSDYWGLPLMNSTTQLSVTSYFMTTLAVVLVILYMFM